MVECKCNFLESFIFAYKNIYIFTILGLSTSKVIFDYLDINSTIFTYSLYENNRFLLRKTSSNRFHIYPIGIFVDNSCNKGEFYSTRFSCFLFRNRMHSQIKESSWICSLPILRILTFKPKRISLCNSYDFYCLSSHNENS